MSKDDSTAPQQPMLLLLSDEKQFREAEIRKKCVDHVCPKKAGGQSEDTSKKEPQEENNGLGHTNETDKEKKLRRKSLLRFHDMPPHLQFNPYIFTGYRPLLTFWGSIHSLFYLHNETINILTHGIPIVYILVTVPSMIPWDKLDTWFLPWCHIVGAVCPWIGSFVYHLFMNLERGEIIYYRLLQIDMLGIWISQSFGALPMVSASVFCLHWALRWLIFSFYCLLSVWGLYKALTAWSPWERRLCFLLPFVMRILLCALRYSKVGGGDPESLVHVILQDAVSALGGAIGAMHIPEKWFPGTVDLYLNSHNIMHVLVVMAVYSMHHATVLDLVWMANVDCKAEHQKQLDVSNKTEL